MTNTDIVQKLWNLCDVLRDDGINYSDYVSELTLLLFIKMEYEQVRNNPDFEHKLPPSARWPQLSGHTETSVLEEYSDILRVLGDHSDPVISAIYSGAETRIREPKHLVQLIKSFDTIDWFSAKKDGLGDLYEGLLEKNASETKSGAGQYFTTRPLIDSIIRCMQPQAGETIQDPAAGTAGFLIAAHLYIKKATDSFNKLSLSERDFQRRKAFIGVELVPSTRRLALMNCLLHGMDGGKDGVVLLGNALGDAGAKLPKVNIVFSNPPFGNAKGGAASISRSFTHKTSNKQLVFLQHIYHSLSPGGRAAVVLPDNVLFEAGAGAEVRRELMELCNLHTILRLPTGIFYAQGVKTNVLFFQKGSIDNPKQTKGCTERIWVYDLRTNMPSFGKRRPFEAEHLMPFERAYGNDPNGRDARMESIASDGDYSRFKCFSRSEIAERGDSLDIKWITDVEAAEVDTLDEPEVLAAQAMAEITEALRELESLMSSLGADDEVAMQRQILADAMGLELNKGGENG